MTGLDYSAGIIPGAAIRAAGHDFCIRYVEDPNQRLSSKHIRPAEYAELTAAGVGVWLVFEIGTDDMLGGLAAGVANARRARAGADWIGYPPGKPIFMASDRHMNPGQVATALAYLDGAASVLGHAATGCYGFTELIAAARAGNHASVFWQCGADPGASSGVHLWQNNTTSTAVAGVACDINELYQPLSASTPTHRGDNVLDNFRVTGTGTIRLICPVGKASAVTARAFISATADGPAAGTVHAWFQDDAGGLSDKVMPVPFANGHSGRPWAELPDGCTQVNVQYQFAGGGTICLEAISK